MAKLRKEDILGIVVTMYRDPEIRPLPYPVGWKVRVRGGCRTFASYGKEFYKYEYPVSKLPKVVQEYIGNVDLRKCFVNEGKKDFLLRG